MGGGGGLGWMGVEQEWSKGDAPVTALAPQQCGPRSNPGVDTICGLSLLLVPSPLLREVLSRILRFSSPLKNMF